MPADRRRRRPRRITLQEKLARLASSGQSITGPAGPGKEMASPLAGDARGIAGDNHIATRRSSWAATSKEPRNVMPTLSSSSCSLDMHPLSPSSSRSRAASFGRTAPIVPGGHGNSSQTVSPARRRSGEPRHAAEAASRRRGEEEGRTVNQMQTGGGRYLKYRPPPGSLPAVGWSTCGPDHARFAQAGTWPSSPVTWQRAGAGIAPRRRPARTARRRRYNRR
ncbi:hypothetical protein PVAP13_2KG065216 [Panicum virgatum]|uniref:Uncharacterized protein n=1 Tax=Panicum virgatum TaxID=38727 RepID=A0A8T0W3S6_PANVG|nr:hypothetical protein PVAP13_2KG065216 [Panicum virgatum]